MRIICGIVALAALISLHAQPPKLDLGGDPLPPGAYARFGSARLRHSAKAVAFLDAKTLVSFGESIRTWDVATGKMKSEIAATTMRGAIAAAFSGDGKTLISAHRPNL